MIAFNQTHDQMEGFLLQQTKTWCQQLQREGVVTFCLAKTNRTNPVVTDLFSVSLKSINMTLGLTVNTMKYS